MGEERKLNILVLGNSGAGKSTLIGAVSGIDVPSGTGEGHTQSIKTYESATWPLRFIDTMGFEYSLIKQISTILQVKKFTSEQTDGKGADEGVDAVWYCIDGTSRRTFINNIEMANRALKGWKNVPVFAVITKSYSEKDTAENIEDAKKAFYQVKNVNFKGVYPVVAETYYITDDTFVEPKGIAELCAATVGCKEEALAINDENMQRMMREQKTKQAQALTAGATAAGVIVAAVPIPFADSVILMPLEVSLTKGILKIYGIESRGELLTSIVGSAAITSLAHTVLSSLKAVPIAGSVLNAVVAGFFISALGEAVIGLSEAVARGIIDINKVDEATEFITDKLRDNPALGFAVEYLLKNADKLKDKNAKEIFREITGAFKK